MNSPFFSLYTRDALEHVELPAHRTLSSLPTAAPLFVLSYNGHGEITQIDPVYDARHARKVRDGYFQAASAFHIRGLYSARDNMSRAAAAWETAGDRLAHAELVAGK